MSTSGSDRPDATALLLVAVLLLGHGLAAAQEAGNRKPVASPALRTFLSQFQPMLVPGRGASAASAVSDTACQPAEAWFGYDDALKANVSLYVVGCAGRPNVRMTVPDDATAPVTYEVDRDGDGLPDAQFFSARRDQRITASVWDDAFDGRFNTTGDHDAAGAAAPTRKRTASALPR